MPLTIAHPAAVIPLQRMLRRWTVPSALVIGSIAPDLAYVLPFVVSRAASHSIAALLWFCLPVGWTVYVLFHLGLKRPLISLAPLGLLRRLSAFASGTPRLPAAPWFAVPASLVLGAVHLAWDAFTHEDGAAVRVLGFLRAPLFAVGTYRVFVYRVLQHGSTVIGVLFIGWWVLRWLRSAPVGPAPAALLTPTRRLVGVAILFGFPASFGILSALWNLSAPVGGLTFRVAAGKAVLSSFSAFGLVLLAFGVWWHVWFAPARSSTPPQSTP